MIYRPELEKLTVRGPHKALTIKFKPSSCFTKPGLFPPPQTIDPCGLFSQRHRLVRKASSGHYSS